MKRIILLIIISAVSVISVAQEQLESRTRISTGGYNYWLYTPPTAYEEAKPLIVFLHGHSLCGSDLNKVRKYGVITAIERGFKIDSYVIAPQNPGGSWVPSKVWEIVESTQNEYNIDTNRIYVIGMSLGGYGTFSVASTYPDKIAAAMALCGGGWNLDYAALDKLPLWILHGTSDRAVSISQSQKIVDGIKSKGTGGRLLFTILPGMDHGALNRCFYLPQTYEWLLSHSLSDEGRPARRDLSITVTEMKNAYQNFNKNTTIKVVKGESSATTFALESELYHESSPSKASNPEYYTIKNGDSLSKIAKKKHTTVKKLCQLNGLKETSTLRVGKRIRIR